jgi:DNA-binding LytR/AlgR family response regulator
MTLKSACRCRRSSARTAQPIANLDKVATISPLFKGALLLKMKDAAGSEIQVSERQAKHVRELLQL